MIKLSGIGIVLFSLMLSNALVAATIQGPGVNYGQPTLNAFTEGDARFLKDSGFKVIRVSFRPGLVLQGGAAGKRQLDGIKSILAKCADNSLDVVLNAHPGGRWLPFFSSVGGAPALTKAWKQVLRHITLTSHIYLEPLNEPHFKSTTEWRNVEYKLALAIRAAAPQTTIVLAANHWDTARALLSTTPLPLKNIIYTFHEYYPREFTLQGSQGFPTGIAWRAQGRVAGILKQRVAAVHAWSVRYGVPVFCGEFGVHRLRAADTKYRIDYIAFLVQLFDSHNIPWSIWQYRTGWGITTRDTGLPVISKSMRQALGIFR